MKKQLCIAMTLLLLMSSAAYAAISTAPPQEPVNETTGESSDITTGEPSVESAQEVMEKAADESAEASAQVSADEALAETGDGSGQVVKVGLPFFSSWGETYYGRINPDSGELEGYAPDVFHEIEKADPSLTFELVAVQMDDLSTLAAQAEEAGCDLLVGSFVGGVDLGNYEAFGQSHPFMFIRMAYVTNNPDTPASVTFDDLADSEVAVYDTYEWVADSYNAEHTEHPVTVVTKAPEERSLMIDEISSGAYAAILPVGALNPYRYDLSALSISSLPEVDMNLFSVLPWAYHKDRKELAEHVSEVLLQMMKAGALTDISVSYFGIDASLPTDAQLCDEDFWTRYEHKFFD